MQLPASCDDSMKKRFPRSTPPCTDDAEKPTEYLLEFLAIYIKRNQFYDFPHFTDFPTGSSIGLLSICDTVCIPPPPPPQPQPSHKNKLKLKPKLKLKLKLKLSLSYA